MTTPAEQLANGLKAGIATGLLPATATLVNQDNRPWPVTLLTALGAWLAAVPLIGVIGLLLGDVLSRGLGPYVTGVLILVAAVTVLRSRSLPVFVEQLAVPALLVGSGALCFGLFRDVSSSVAAACLAVLALGLAMAVQQAWLRVLLGAAGAAMLTWALQFNHGFTGGESSGFSFWLALHGALLLGIFVWMWQQRLRAQRAAALESICTGWLLAVLVGACAWSGMTFLVGGNLGGGFWGSLAQSPVHSGLARTQWLLTQAGSAGLAGLAAFMMARSWPSLRQPLVAVVGLVLAALCWFMPALGAALLALSWLATSQRWRLAMAAAFAAVWIVGGFYYQLEWTLANKAVVLVGFGVVLGLAAWWAVRRDLRKPHHNTLANNKRAAVFIAAGTFLTLAVANFGIWQKETLIARGDKLFVALAPVDPRSLMQGDFMRLNYGLPGGGWAEPGQGLTGRRPHVIARRDARGVAELLRIDASDTPLAADEMRLELTPKAGRWILVSDAWFFREGDAKRWEAAKYGEFRVSADGKALLVGLADATLQPISIQP